MILKSLEIANYRNYETQLFELSPGTNVLYGDNAQGKTNALEAIYFCAMGRSHRPGRDKEVIRFGSGEGHIRLCFEREGVPHRIDVHLKESGRKGIAVDGIPIRRAVDLYGALHVIIFAPEDLAIIKSAPQQRRNFIDMELCQLDRVYASNLINLGKALTQKSRLLKSIPDDPSLEETLPLWNEQLVKYAVPVIKRRRSFIAELDALTKGIHTGITGGAEELTLVYEPNCSEDELEACLNSGMQRELRSGLCLFGPQRDDMSFLINGKDARAYGSQGQQRTAALSLKLSEIELVKTRTRDDPVMLLDDVLSELDSGRQRRLLRELSGVQTVLTCTGLSEITGRAFRVDRAFLVENGKVVKETNIENGE